MPRMWKALPPGVRNVELLIVWIDERGSGMVVELGVDFFVCQINYSQIIKLFLGECQLNS